MTAAVIMSSPWRLGCSRAGKASRMETWRAIGGPHGGGQGALAELVAVDGHGDDRVAVVGGGDGDHGEDAGGEDEGLVAVLGGDVLGVGFAEGGEVEGGEVGAGEGGG